MRQQVKPLKLWEAKYHQDRLKKLERKQKNENREAFIVQKKLARKHKLVKGQWYQVARSQLFHKTPNLGIVLEHIQTWELVMYLGECIRFHHGTNSYVALHVGYKDMFGYLIFWLGGNECFVSHEQLWRVRDPEKGNHGSY